MEAAMVRSEAARTEKRTRAQRLGFRVDDQTKALVERAAQLERRKMTDFCVTVLTEAARKTIEWHETIVLSDRDREVFFETLINPPAPNERLKRAFKAYRRRVGS
ncbi:MAG: type II toxin-antitoxin system TacA family antitoxin [Pseudomonadota bacterium]